MSQSDAGGEGARIAPLCASFNQDCTSLAVGTISGYKLFSLTSVDRLEEIYKCTDTPDVYIVERLFSSSLVVIVSLSTPQKMNVYHFKKGTEICNYSYSNTILTVRLNRQRLVVCLEESIYIHNIKDLKLLKTIQDIPPNRTGLCALSINHSNSYLAYPGNATIGEIVIYDANNLHSISVIPAHDGPLAALTFNCTGSKLASASEKGTVIRVFSIPEGEKLYEFRRGMKRYVNIGSLAFSGDSQFLSASSNTETIHIFKLEQPSQSRPQEESPSWSGYMGKMFMAATNYLPTQVSGIINQDRAFATVRLNFSGQRSICTLTVIQKLPRLLVAASDGFLYIYNLDPHDGGECVLIKKHRYKVQQQVFPMCVETGNLTGRILFKVWLGCYIKLLNHLLEKRRLHNEDDNNDTAKSDLTPSTSPTYAATVAKTSLVPSPSTAPGYSEDGGTLHGEIIPEHEFAAGPLHLDDETEFPPVCWKQLVWLSPLYKQERPGQPSSLVVEHLTIRRFIQAEEATVKRRRSYETERNRIRFVSEDSDLDTTI